MAAPLLHRIVTAELRARAAGDGERERIIEGRIVPFGEIANVRDSPNGKPYRETIARGATDSIIPERVLFDYLTEPPRDYSTHEGSKLAGRGIAGSADHRDDGTHMAFRIARTANGDEALGLADDGILTDLSIYFRPVPGGQRTRADGVLERTAIDVRRVTAVPLGAYGDGAQITAVRAATEGGDMPQDTTPQGAAETDESAETDEQTPAPRGETRPNRTRVTTQVDVERAGVDAADERARAGREQEAIDGLARNARSAGYVTRPEAIYGPHQPHTLLADGYRAKFEGDMAAADRLHRHQLHLADVAGSIERSQAWNPDGSLSRAGDMLSSEIPGAYPNDYLPGLLTPRILKGRPMGGFYDRFPIADARPRVFPKVTTSTTVAVQSAEGAALSATDIATTAVTANPLIYGAYVDVSRQVIDGADPSAQTMLLADLFEAYAQASEAVIKTAVEAGSTASGVAITAATPYAGAIANVVNYYGTRFTPARGAFIPPAQFSTLLAQADSTGRPLIPQIGAVNSDGTVNVNGTISAPLLNAQGTLSWASTANVWVFGVPSDFVIFESSIAQFSYDQPVGPQAVRIGIWAYLVVGTRLGSLKVTAA